MATRRYDGGRKPDEGDPPTCPTVRQDLEEGGPTMVHPTSRSDNMRLLRGVRRGIYEKLDHGLYLVNPGRLSSHHDLAAVAIRAPEAVICCESAAAFHGLTSNVPPEVQFSLKGRPRSWKWPAIRMMNILHREQDIQVHDIEGVPTRITTDARTVVDCLLNEASIGQQQLQEILWSCHRSRSGAIADIGRIARELGVHERILAYLHTVQGP